MLNIVSMQENPIQQLSGWSKIIQLRHKKYRQRVANSMQSFYLYWLGREQIHSRNIFHVLQGIKEHQLKKQGINCYIQLYLGYNCLGNQGLAKLSQVQMPKLIWLSLANNYISSEGCMFLAKASWNELEELDLRSNNIGYEGCRHLVKVDWKKIKKIHLQNNNICEEGYAILDKKWSRVVPNIAIFT